MNDPMYQVREMPSGKRIDVWYDNAIDQGQTSLRKNEMPEPTHRPLLQFLFPNLWQNWLGGSLRLVIAFVPVDDAHTMMYIRNYQAMARAPILREVFNAFSALGNWVIERQDRRVVVAQMPKRADLRMGETLIPADGAIIEYRKLRNEMIQSAGGNP